jgi:hypothetical protein
MFQLTRIVLRMLPAVLVSGFLTCRTSHAN